MRGTIAVGVLAVFLAIGAASAQTPVMNPTKVEFMISADHAQLTSYTIGYFLPGATDPVQTAILPLGTPDAQQKVEQPINSVPLGFGVYTAKIKAVAGTVSSEWSASSNEFARVPFPPTVPIVKK